jgi:hypothetical protein
LYSADIVVFWVVERGDLSDLKGELRLRKKEKGYMLRAKEVFLLLQSIE